MGPVWGPWSEDYLDMKVETVCTNCERRRGICRALAWWDADHEANSWSNKLGERLRMSKE